MQQLRGLFAIAKLLVLCDLSTILDERFFSGGPSLCLVISLHCIVSLSSGLCVYICVMQFVHSNLSQMIISRLKPNISDLDLSSSEPEGSVQACSSVGPSNTVSFQCCICNICCVNVSV